VKSLQFEGRVEVTTESELGYYQIFIGDRDFGAEVDAARGWRTVGGRVVVWVQGEEEPIVDAEGNIYAYEGEEGYSSWTPGCGPDVTVYDVASGSTAVDVTDKLEGLDGRTVAVLVEFSEDGD
jgi:hypothetical protein